MAKKTVIPVRSLPGKEEERTFGHLLRTRLDRALFAKNAILLQGIGLCPVVAVAVSVKTGMLLAIINTLLLLPLTLFSSLLLKKVPAWLRAALYFMAGIGLVAAVYNLCYRYAPSTMIALGVYFPLLTVNSLVIYRCEGYAVKNKPINALLDGVLTSLSAGLVFLLVGTIRELLGAGSFFGLSLGKLPKAAGLLSPFGGFIILGFLAAILQFYLNHRRASMAVESSPVPAQVEVEFLHEETVEDTVAEKGERQ